MNPLNVEITETINLMQESDDMDVRDALRAHLDGLLGMRRDRIARNSVEVVRLGSLVPQNAEIPKEE